MNFAETLATLLSFTFDYIITFPDRTQSLPARTNLSGFVNTPRSSPIQVVQFEKLSREEVVYANTKSHLYSSPYSHIAQSSQELIRSVMTTFRDVVHADRCCIFCVDHSSDSLVAVLADHISSDLMKEYRLKEVGPRVGLAAAAAITGQIINTANAYDDERFDPSIDQTY